MNPRSLGRHSRRRNGWLAVWIVAPALLLASEVRAGDPPKPDGDPDQTTQSEVSRILPSLELRIREAFANAHAFVSARLGLDVSAIRRH